MQRSQVTAKNGVLKGCEKDSSPERVHGYFETVALFAGDFIKLNQIRPGENAVLQELKDSIENQGMLNPIDCARLSPELLAEYIEFTNQVWGGAKKIEDFDDYRVDDHYHLVCAGHSRHESIVQLEQEGRIDTLRILAKVHKVESVQDILDLQDAENVHSRAPVERRSFVAVEAYLWGLEQGYWSSIDEYAQLRGLSRQKKSLVADAVLFVELPNTLREFVFQKKVSYTAGVELARASALLRKSIVLLFGEEQYENIADPELKAEIEQQVLISTVVKMNIIAEARLNSTAAVKVLKAWQKQLRASMQPTTDEPQGMLDVMISPREQLAAMRREAHAEMRRFIEKYSHTPASAALDLLALNAGFVDPEVAASALDDFIKSAQDAAHLRGGATLRAVGHTDSANVLDLEGGQYDA